jgi:hypothetical protein
MADESIVLRVGQEHPVRLTPHDGPDDWTFEVGGMTSAVDVRKMWTSRPYEEDDEDRTSAPPPRFMVFIIRGAAPGEATVQFRSVHGESYEADVRVQQ